MHDEREMDGLGEDGGYGSYSTGGPPIQLLGRREFIRNPEERALFWIGGDKSRSMQGKPIAEVNAGLKMYPKLLAEDGLASKRVETAVMSFGGSVKLEQDFATVENLRIPELTAGGDTPMSEAILRGLDLIEARIQVYGQNSVSYRKPWMFLLSDGAPTDKELWPEAVRRVREEERAKRIEFFSIGIGEYADMDRLAELSARPPARLHPARFLEFFKWLAQSTRAVSASMPGQLVLLPPTDPWRGATS